MILSEAWLDEDYTTQPGVHDHVKTNSDTALYKLPAEVIQTILCELRCGDDEYIRRFTDPGWTGIVIEWVPVMLVCRRLRDVALGAAVLWSFIDMDHASQDWYELCISRASNHPLYLRGTLRHDTQALNQRIFQLIPKSHHLQLVIPSQGEMADDPAVDEKLAVLLKSFMDNYVNVEQSQIRTLRMHNLTQFWIFANARFMGGCPHQHLTSLCLRGFHVEEIPAMPALREMTIRQMRLDTDCSRVRKILLGTPQLEFLRIDEPFSDRMESPATLYSIGKDLQKAEPVCLPMLAVLHLCGAPQEIGRLVHILPDPSSKLMILIRDINANSAPVVLVRMNPEMRPVLQDYSQAIYRRIVSFLQKATDDGKLQPHSLVLRPAEDYAFQYLTTVVELLADQSHSSQRRLSVRLPIYDLDFSDSRVNFNEIGGYAQRVRIVFADRLSDFGQFIIESENLEHLIISHMSRQDKSSMFSHSGTYCNQEPSPNFTEIITGLLRNRAQGGNASLQKLTLITEVKHAWNEVNPKGIVDDAAVKEWSAAGWVHEVELIPCQCALCDGESIRQRIEWHAQPRHYYRME